MTSGRCPTLLQCALFISCLLLVLGAADAAMAQPFGMTRGSAPSPFGGFGPLSDFTGWMFAKQAEFYRMLSGAIRAAKADGTAAWGLMGISFAYGIFHAAGPGHGKAVISSYLVANDETWRRGIALSFASAVLQSFTAIAIVGIAAVLLGATAHVMGNAVRAIEMVSYALIILIGLRLLWVKGRAFWLGLASFYVIGAIGVVANVGIADLLFRAGRSWWLAGVAGALMGVVWNFTMSSIFTWRRGGSA